MYSSSILFGFIGLVAQLMVGRETQEVQYNLHVVTQV